MTNRWNFKPASYKYCLNKWKAIIADFALLSENNFFMLCIFFVVICLYIVKRENSFNLKSKSLDRSCKIQTSDSWRIAWKITWNHLKSHLTFLRLWRSFSLSFELPHEKDCGVNGHTMPCQRKQIQSDRAQRANRTHSIIHLKLYSSAGLFCALYYFISNVWNPKHKLIEGDLQSQIAKWKKNDKGDYAW